MWVIGGVAGFVLLAVLAAAIIFVVGGGDRNAKKNKGKNQQAKKKEAAKNASPSNEKRYESGRGGGYVEQESQDQSHCKLFDNWLVSQYNSGYGDQNQVYEDNAYVEKQENAYATDTAYKSNPNVFHNEAPPPFEMNQDLPAEQVFQENGVEEFEMEEYDIDYQDDYNFEGDNSYNAGNQGY